MFFTIVAVAVLAGTSYAAPAPTTSQIPDAELLCYSPQKHKTFCGEVSAMTSNSDFKITGTTPATATFQKDDKDNYMNVEICFPYDKNKCYKATALEQGELFENVVKGPGKDHIAIMIGNQQFLVDKKNDQIKKKHGKHDKRADPVVLPTAFPFPPPDRYFVGVSGLFQNAVQPAPVNTTTGALNNSTSNPIQNGTAAGNFTTSYVTRTVASYVTYCPTPTVFTQGKQVFTVTAPSLVTITDCPCTIVQPSIASVISARPTTRAPFRIANGTSPSGTGAFIGTGTGVIPVQTVVVPCPTCPGGVAVSVINNDAAQGTGIFNNGAAQGSGAFNNAVATAPFVNGTVAGVSATGINGAAPTNVGAAGSNPASASNVSAAGSNPESAANVGAAGNNAATAANVGAVGNNAATTANAGAVGNNAATVANAGAAGATNVGSTSASSTNSNVGAFQGAATTSTPSVFGALVAVAAAAFLF